MSRVQRILIVDDELPNRRVLEAILTIEGFDVAHATSGREAIEAIEAGGIDLVLLDVLMPEMDGIETCRVIRTELDEPLLPIIMVTALSDRSSRTRSKLCGADDYLVKPIYEDELLARVRNLLARNTYYRDAERERARAEAEAQRWKLVSDVASVVAICTDYETLQLSIRDLLRPHVPIHRFVVLETRGDSLQLPASINRSVPPPNALCGPEWKALWRERCVVRAEQFAAELAPIQRSFHDWRPAYGAMLPLHVGATLQGMLVVFTTRTLTEDELLLIDELGPHLTNAVTNVRSHVNTKQLNEARDRLSLLLVHDLKNPLSVISMNLEHLATCGRSADSADALHDARAASERMLHMIMDLLDIGRAEEGRLTLRRRRDSVNSVVDAVLARFSTNAAHRKARLSSDLVQDVTVDFDRELLTRVLENLVGNALRFVPDGGFVDVETRVDEDGALMLRVTNNGPRFTPTVRARMFEKYGGDAAHQSGPNRGLGLYFCRLVVEAHGGTIDAVNLPDTGVTFEMRIPGAEGRVAARRDVLQLSVG